VDGGANWMSNSYSPLTRLLYIFARDERRVFTKNAVRHVNYGQAPLNNFAPKPDAPPELARAAAQNTGIFGAGGNLPAGAVRF
jgi:hypothetical protein